MGEVYMIMKNRQSGNFLIFTILFSGLLFRFLKILEDGHQTGVDTWNYHQLISQISNHGEINWNLNILSLWGFYPPFAEMGGLILRTTFMQVSGLSLEISLIFYSLAYSLLSFFSMFILSHRLFKKAWLAIYCSSAFYLSNYIVNGTIWIIHLRTDLAIFTPVTIFFLLEFINKKSVKHFLLVLHNRL